MRPVMYRQEWFLRQVMLLATRYDLLHRKRGVFAAETLAEAKQLSVYAIPQDYCLAAEEWVNWAIARQSKPLAPRPAWATLVRRRFYHGSDSADQNADTARSA